jgi:hypothetical protein
MNEPVSLRFGIICRLTFEFKKRGQLFVGTNDESLSIVAVCVCREKHAASRISLR